MSTICFLKQCLYQILVKHLWYWQYKPDNSALSPTPQRQMILLFLHFQRGASECNIFILSWLLEKEYHLPSKRQTYHLKPAFVSPHTPSSASRAWIMLMRTKYNKCYLAAVNEGRFLHICHLCRFYPVPSSFVIQQLVRLFLVSQVSPNVSEPIN